MQIGLRVKCPLFLLDFEEYWISSTDFRKILGLEISWKSFQLEPSCSVQTGRQKKQRQTDMTKLTVAFRNFAHPPRIKHWMLYRAQSSLLYIGYRVFPGGKAAGTWRWRPNIVKERVELYLYSPSGPSWPVLGWTLPSTVTGQNSLLALRYIQNT
jgi:hypothetical protein